MLSVFLAAAHFGFAPCAQQGDEALPLQTSSVAASKSLSLESVWGHYRPGHGRNPHAAAASPDGRHIASADPLTGLSLWESATGRMLSNQPFRATGLAFAQDGKTVFAACGRELVEFSVPAGKVLKKTTGKGAFYVSVTASTDGKWLLVGCERGVVQLLDRSNSAVEWSRRLHAPRSPVTRVAFIDEGREILTFNHRELLRSRVSDGQILLRLEETARSCRFLGFTATGMRGLSSRVVGGSSQALFVWDLKSGKRVHKLRPTITDSGRFTGACLSADGQRALVWYRDLVQLWNLRTGKVSKPVVMREPSALDGVAEWRPDGGRFAIGRQGSGTVSPPQAVFLSVFPKSVWPDEGAVNHLAMSRNGQHVAIAGADGRVRLVRLKDDHELWRFKDARYPTFYSTAFTPDGKQLLAGSVLTAALIDTETGKHRFHARPLSGRVAITADGMRGISLGRSKEDLVSCRLDAIWPVKYFRERSSKQKFLAMSSNATIAAGLRRGADEKPEAFLIWDVKRETLLHTVTPLGGLAAEVAFSPKGDRLLAAWSDGNVVVHDFAAKTNMRWQVGRGLCRSVVADRDLNHLAVLIRKELILCDLRTEKQLDRVEFTEITGLPLAALFTHDGEHLLVGMSNGVVLEYRVRRGD